MPPPLTGLGPEGCLGRRRGARSQACALRSSAVEAEFFLSGLAARLKP